MDATGSLCLDGLTSGVDADPDKNGNPGDNADPTSITMHSVRPAEHETVSFLKDFRRMAMV